MNVCHTIAATAVALGLAFTADISPARASTLSLADIDPSGTVTIKADDVASAEGGGKQKNGMPTTQQQIDAAATHGGRYNGPTVLTATYDIMLNAKNEFVSGTVTLDFSSFSFNPLYPRAGTKSHVVTVNDDQGKTSPIPITGVTLNKDGSIASFTLAGPKWYPPKDNTIKDITDKGITGSINLDNGMVMFVAKYVFDPSETGAVNIYTVTGKIEKPGPGPSGTPLPSTWTLMLIGLAGLGFVASPFGRSKPARLSVA
jgi:hypothetical protein